MSQNPYQVNGTANLNVQPDIPFQPNAANQNTGINCQIGASNGNYHSGAYTNGQSNGLSGIGTTQGNNFTMKNEVIMPGQGNYDTNTGEDNAEKNGGNRDAEILALKNLNVAHRQNLEMATGGDYNPADFTDKTTRNGFIKKVFGILSVQLFITFFFTLGVVLSRGLQDFLLKNWYIAIITSVISLIIIYIIVYSKLGRKVPWNYILLFVFTLAESVTVGFITANTVRASDKGPYTVALAAGLTAAIVTALALYAAFTKKDFTKCGPFLLVCLVALMIGSICFYFFFRDNMVLNLVISVVGVIVFGLYLIMDIQLVMGNKKNKLQKDDYVLAAMMLYIDIIQIFIYLLQIIGAVNR